jgi:hypothetical protein
MKVFRAVLALALATLTASADGGQRIEASFFPRDHLDLESRWLVENPRPGTDARLGSEIIAESDFTELRLAIPPSLVGKNVRIFLTLPTSTQGAGGPNGLEAQWKTQGVFRSGSVRPGDRVLFFEGAVDQNPLRDLIAYTFRIDARYSTGVIRFEPEYDIEER